MNKVVLRIILRSLSYFEDLMDGVFVLVFGIKVGVDEMRWEGRGFFVWLILFGRKVLEFGLEV